MDLNNIVKLGKVQHHQHTEKSKRQHDANEVSFSEILDKELSQKSSEISQSNPLIPSQSILNIKQVSLDDAFINKGFETFEDLTNALGKFKDILSENKFDTESAKSTINEIKNLIGKLENIAGNVGNQNIKEEFNRAILIGNVEIEKYLRGEYF